MALTTLANVKEYLSITDTSQDDLLNNLIERSSEWIKNFTQRELELLTDIEEDQDGQGGNEMYAREYPVTDDTTFKLEQRDGGTFGSPTYAEISTDDYLVYPLDGRIVYPGGFIKGYSQYRITYSAGYETSPSFDIPADLENACIKIVQALYKSRTTTTASGDISSEKLGDYQINFTSGGETGGESISTIVSGNDLINSVLARYKRYALGSNLV